MNDLSAADRRFLLTVLGGGLALLLVFVFVHGSAAGAVEKADSSQRSAQNRLRRERARMKRLGPQTVTQLRKAVKESEERAPVREAEVERVRASLAHVPSEGFAMTPAIGQPTSHYGRKLGELRAKISRRFSPLGLVVDTDFGLPRQYPTDREAIDGYLRSMDIIDQVLDYCHEIARRPEGARRWESPLTEIPKIRVQKTKRSRAEGPVRALSVAFTLEGEMEGIDRLVRRIVGEEKEGRRLVVLSASIRSLDTLVGVGRAKKTSASGRGSRVEATVQVAALAIAAPRPADETE
jgi:hypothetical protein